MQQTSVAIATKTRVGVGLVTKLAVSLGVVGATAAFAAAMLPGAADDGGSLFDARASVVVQVQGQGRVVSSPRGIACPGSCQATFPVGATVVLSAEAAPSAVFEGWRGPCRGDGGCSLVVAAAGGTVGASFRDRLAQVTLNVEREGEGSVVANPGGIACGSDCSQVYPQGTTVTLTAVPATGSTFRGWAGTCSGSAPVCVLTLSSDSWASARFAP